MLGFLSILFFNDSTTDDASVCGDSSSSVFELLNESIFFFL